ncbi:hypothetical protein PGTUg99_022430 [Puccinia graminis f. sp. tritici]|uniref:Uncharacterized protein n=1 Tax=Puccinia graminis f. sp. tritici TaxID=56615 RepID=A0A5B0SHP5_PUCGR|nr:hypothetical protein PGTUg99_022430 [Puccinia graminis f. sp. tritici]
MSAKAGHTPAKAGHRDDGRSLGHPPTFLFPSKLVTIFATVPSAFTDLLVLVWCCSISDWAIIR